MNKTAKKVAFSFVLGSALLYSSCADYPNREKLFSFYCKQ